MMVGGSDERPSVALLRHNLNITALTQPVGVSGCEHYAKRCALVCLVCQKNFLCHRCHEDHVRDSGLPAHDILATPLVLCLECEHVQRPSQDCELCGVRFAKYFCSQCLVWDDDRPLYHCSDCRVCRVGHPDLVQHCNSCQTCHIYPLVGKHIPGMSKQDCCICLEGMNTSYMPLAVIPVCGHVIHWHCLTGYWLSAGHQTEVERECPLCKSVITRHATPELLATIKPLSF